MYVLINNAPDGRHIRPFGTLAKAQAALEDFLGRPVSGCAPDTPYYGDWGNRLVIEQRPDGWSAKLEQRFGAAYDAREMGRATRSQLALLAQFERAL